MRFARRAAASVLAPTLLAVAVSGCESTTATRKPAEIVIGADLELSGPGAVVGAAYERALRLKIEEINNSGVLESLRLTLRVTDNYTDPTLALRNIRSFAADSAVAAVITGQCSECVVGAATSIDADRLPTISLAPAREVSTPVAKRRYLFKLWPDALDNAAALVGELRRRKVKRAAILYADNMYGRDGRRAMAAALAKSDITLASAAKVKPTDPDSVPAVRRLIAEDPDALVVWAFPGQANNAATAARKAGFKGDVFFDAAAADDLFLPQSSASATNNTTLVFTHILAVDDVIATTPAKAARKQWFRDYTSRYGSYSGVAAFAADAVKLIAEAVARVGDDREAIREVLESAKLDGLSGPIQFTANDHSGLLPQSLALLVARGGRWRLAG